MFPSKYRISFDLSFEDVAILTLYPDAESHAKWHYCVTQRISHLGLYHTVENDREARIPNMLNI